MTNVKKKDSATKLKRLALSRLSKKARTFREEKVATATNEKEALLWASKTINDIVLMWYKENSGATEFKSFFQWKQDGFSVKKGQKAFLLWAKRRNATAKIEKPENQDPEEEDYMFYPLAYLFSDLQVEKIEPKEPEPVETEEVDEYEDYYEGAYDN